MARIAGIDLPREKRIEYGLTYVHGIGVTTARKILERAKISFDKRVKDITDDEARAISEAIHSMSVLVEGDLRRKTSLDVKRLIEIKSYRGSRHLKGLPVRGQRTKTNARTRKSRKGQKSSSKKKFV